MPPFQGFQGYGSKKPVNQPAANQPKRVGFSDVGNKGSYTPGGDSFKNYSQKDQQTMFQQAGGKKNFLDQVANIEQKYKRSADIQRYLDRTNLYNQFQNRGDGIVKDAQGRTILSMQSPYMTAQAPTFGQLLGDMGRGIGSIFQGIAEKGTPMMQLGKGVLGGIQNFFSNAFNPGDIGGQLKAAGPEAQQKYTQLMQQPGMTYQQAFEMATGVPFTKPESQTLNVSSEPTNEVSKFKQGLTNPQLAIFNYHYNSGNSPDYARQMALMGVPMAQGGVASL